MRVLIIFCFLMFSCAANNKEEVVVNQQPKAEAKKESVITETMTLTLENRVRYSPLSRPIFQQFPLNFN